MASIYLDGQSRNWKLKSTDGRVRTTLRRATANEPKRPVPDDVMILARQHGYRPKDEVPKAAAPKIAVAESIESVIVAFETDYGIRSRAGSIKRMAGILLDFRRFLRLHPELKTIGDITSNTIKVYFAWRLKQVDQRLQIQVKPTYVIGCIELLSGLFKFAIEEKLIASNPTTNVLKQLRQSNPRPRPEDQTKYLDPDEVKRFLADLDAAVKDGSIPVDYADLAKVMLSTGMRVQAAIHLDYAWISRDWDLKVPSQFDKGKTGYSTVVASLGQEVLTRRRGLQISGRVFGDKITQDMSYYYLQRLGKIGNHTLRHSFATASVDAGTPLQIIMELLGQKDLKTCQRYAKVRSQAKRDAVARLNFGT